MTTLREEHIQYALELHENQVKAKLEDYKKSLGKCDECIESNCQWQIKCECECYHEVSA